MAKRAAESLVLVPESKRNRHESSAYLTLNNKDKALLEAVKLAITSLFFSFNYLIFYREFPEHLSYVHQ